MKSGIKKLNIIVVTISLLFLLFSCNNAEIKETTDKVDTITVIEEDTANVEPEIIYSNELIDLIDLFEINESNNLSLDSNYLSNTKDKDESKRLNSKQVKILSSELLEHEYTQNVSYDLTIFYKIDSLKSVGAYEEYVNSLDIGMMKMADAYAIENLKFDDGKTELLIWYIEYSTYEACPYAAGIDIFGTLLFEGKITTSALLAESMSAGDPPSGMERYIYCNIDENTKLTYEFMQINEDENDNGYISDTSKNSVILSLKNKTIDLN